MKNLTLTFFVTGLVGFTPLLQAKVDFAKEIQPVLAQNCFKCHGPEKQKGKLRLDSKDAALKGGKGGPAFVAGNAEKSELYRRITLPKNDDDFMPAEGEPLPKATLELIKTWLNEGAEWTEVLAKVSEAPKKPSVPAPVLPADFKPGSGEAKAIATLTKAGVDVRPIAINSPWREANFRLQGTSVTDQVIAPIKDITSLVDLNLATTRITDAGLATLKPLVNLQRLHLELTKVGDAGLAQIKGLKNLTYLNLYGTQVTDAGLDNLKDMKFLRNLYVWQSKVTDAGVKKLKESLPNLEVSTGWDLAALAKIEEDIKKREAEKKEAEKKAEEAKKAEAKKAEDAKKEEAKKAEAAVKKDDAKQ